LSDPADSFSTGDGDPGQVTDALQHDSDDDRS
jgi:hypothetical protein